MNLDKLKESARRFEQKEDWRRAIEVYQRALTELEAQGDPIPDPSVYNRVGDLQMKVGETAGAVRSYEQALELYAEQGFFNNAIALGGKILRVDGGRTPTYLRLAQLHARKDVVPEVRRHLTGFLKGMRHAHRGGEAVAAMREFVDKHCRNAEMRAVVAELLSEFRSGGDPSDAMGRLADELRSREGREGTRATDQDAPAQVRGLVFLDTNPDWNPVAPPSPAAGAGVEPVDGLTTIEATLPSAIGGLPLIGLESSEFIVPDTLPLERISGMDLEEVSFLPGDGVVSPELLIDIEGPAGDPAAGLIGEAPPTEEYAPTRPAGATGLAPGGDDLAIEIFDRMDSDDLVVEVIPGEDVEGPPTLGDEVVLVDLDEPAETMEPPRAATAAELEAELAALEAREEWEAALAVAGALVRLEPSQIPRYQKQVELAYRAGDTHELSLRYLELGDALLRAGMRAPAVAVFRRVLEHEPGHSRAMGALASLGVSMQPSSPPAAAAPATPPEPPPREYVDLGALILDDQPERDSRMRVDAAEPTAPEDEDATFQEILSQFKRGIEANLDSEDFQAHYDLGIAFKEMGLLDEAIAQFQRALRSPEGRLRASEALGIAFFEKGRFAIAEAVLARAIDGLPGADDEKIGLIYWLGRALEALGREAEALPCYERALAVDIRFLDVTERISRLGAGRQG